MKKFAVAALSLALLFILFFYLLTRALPMPETRETLAPACYSGVTLIIDAGHGGEDGGAVSLSGAVESGINLAIARRLELIAALYGVPTVMLRSEDISLHDSTAETLREKKNSDLHNRVDAVNGVENGVLISIHQNTYQNPKYSGAQVFYAPTEGSRAFAEFTQEILRLTLNVSNQRQATQIPDTVYLMNHVSKPAILVECGFLSNAMEDQLLQTPEYQLLVAAALAGAYLQYQDTLG